MADRKLTYVLRFSADHVAPPLATVVWTRVVKTADGLAGFSGRPVETYRKAPVLRDWDISAPRFLIMEATPERYAILIEDIRQVCDLFGVPMGNFSSAIANFTSLEGNIE